MNMFKRSLAASIITLIPLGHALAAFQTTVNLTFLPGPNVVCSGGGQITSQVHNTGLTVELFGKIFIKFNGHGGMTSQVTYYGTDSAEETTISGGGRDASTSYQAEIILSPAGTLAPSLFQNDFLSTYNTLGQSFDGQMVMVGSTSVRGAFPNGVDVLLIIGNTGTEFIPALCTGYGRLEIQYTMDIVEL